MINTWNDTRTTQSPEQGVADELHQFFESYGAAFSDLVSGERSDVKVLLNFYGPPLRWIGASEEVVMTAGEDITGRAGLGGEISRLQHAHMAGSTVSNWNVRVLNSRAALVEAAWSRKDTSGVPATSTFVYLLTQTIDGWRITTVIDITGRH